MCNTSSAIQTCGESGVISSKTTSKGKLWWSYHVYQEDPRVFFFFFLIIFVSLRSNSGGSEPCLPDSIILHPF